MHASSPYRVYNDPLPLKFQTLKPIFRAYAWALLSVTAPRTLTLLVSAIRGQKSIRDAIERIHGPVTRQLGINKLPASFAILISGVVLIPQLLATIAGGCLSRTSARKLHWNPTRWQLLRFLCTFALGLISFKLLNHKEENPDKLKEAHRGNISHADHASALTVSLVADSQEIEARVNQPVPLAGRTLDLTFFAVVRATDISLRTLWGYFIPPRRASNKAFRAGRTVDSLVGPITFVASSWIIMWAWFYSPYRLPKAYQAWIFNAAQLDERVLTALRECRSGKFIYGRETGAGRILKPLCQELGYPEEWGNPACCNQIPCSVSHCGIGGDSCELHAFQRLSQAWLFAFKMYLPLSILVFLRRKPTLATAWKALQEASRSSAFLGTFVALFYYGVCLARRRVGPKILPGVKPQQWDGGLSVSVGCLLCGTSILLEKPQRRREIAFFVAPRALATLFPRRYDRRYIWREQFVYATCAAIILTAAVERPRQVRGVFGRLLSQVLA